MTNPKDDRPRLELRKPPAPPSGRDSRPPMFSVRPVIIALIVSLVILWLFQLNNDSRGGHVDYMLVWRQVASDNVDRVMFRGETVNGWFKTEIANPKQPDKKLPLQFSTVLPMRQDDAFMALLRDHGVRIDAESQSPGMWTSIATVLLGPLLLIGFMYFMMQRSSDSISSGALGGFIRSPAKRFEASSKVTTFDDVCAMDGAKKELEEIVEFLKAPEKFQKLGATIPKGVLLMGPPGNGKTLLARAVAGEAGVPFYSINGSEFIQMFVGVGASRVRDLFGTAKENAPCIMFIDEIDAVGRVRGAGLGGGHDEREQTLNQILSEMDGFSQTHSVIVIAATNRPDVLDPALLRPGRFDRHVTIDRPNRAGREAILRLHSKNVPLADDVDMADISVATIGFSGAQLKNLVNEAALLAARADKTQVFTADFEEARDKVLMGPQREEIMSRHEREMTAYHEAGHALLGWLQPDVDPVHKVTIIPRGRALGVTQLLPSEERYNIGERRLYSQLAFMLGGRAAEKLIFDEYSAGAEDDLKRATQLVRRMVANWGMSDVIGPVAFRSAEEHPFLGKEIAEAREHSDETAHLIDQEVQRILLDADQRAKTMLREHRAQLEALANGLLEREALDQKEMSRILGIPLRSPEETPETRALARPGEEL